MDLNLNEKVKKEQEEEEEEEEENEGETIKSEINELLDDNLLKFASKHFVTGSAEKYLPSNPGLVVEGIGAIALPISEEIATEFKNLGERSPYGRGKETIVDTQVRSSWDLNTDLVKFENPKWGSGLKKLVAKISEDFGCAEKGVSPKIYKMLLYEKGSHFLTHKDSEKEKGMFATLVIQLPRFDQNFNLKINSKFFGAKIF